MLDKITQFLILQGGTGVLALCAIVAVIFLWRALIRREQKHDGDRNEWLASLLEVTKANSSNQEKIAHSLSMLEEGQKRLYELYHDIIKK